MSEPLTPIETITEVKAELLDLAANEIGRPIEGIQQRCGELAEVLGNAIWELRLIKMGARAVNSEDCEPAPI